MTLLSLTKSFMAAGRPLLRELFYLLRKRG